MLGMAQMATQGQVAVVWVAPVGVDDQAGCGGRREAIAWWRAFNTKSVSMCSLMAQPIYRRQ
jgi:hypothetical protein